MKLHYKLAYDMTKTSSTQHQLTTHYEVELIDLLRHDVQTSPPDNSKQSTSINDLATIK